MSENIWVKKNKKNNPPIHCDEDLQSINVGSKYFIFLKDEKPVPVRPEIDSKKAFIHFKNWNKDDKSQYVKDIITSGKDIKIIYSMPWYWICKQSNYY